MGAGCRLHRRRGDPLRFQREGKLELTTAPRSQTVATGIPEGRTARGITCAKFVRAAEMVRWVGDFEVGEHLRLVGHGSATSGAAP